MSIIYCYTNKENGKRYIGQTVNPEQRQRNHIHEAFERNSDYYFHKALRKHGIESFEYEVLEDEVENLTERELHYITKYNSIWPNGYNMITPVCRTYVGQKISEGRKRYWDNATEEERSKILKQLEKGRKNRIPSKKQRLAASLALQKTWEVTHPDGKTETVTNLRKWCISNGLGTNGQSNLTRGKYKGYTAIKKD